MASSFGVPDVENSRLGTPRLPFGTAAFEDDTS
jgi:hypothetical protein